jgi:endonuclease-3
MNKANQICRLLDRAYGRRKFQPHNPPLDELILTVLSQNTSGKNCIRAYESLRERFPSWEDVMQADVRDLEDSIKIGGLGEVKANRIKKILQRIFAETGSLDISWLAEKGVDQAREWLMSFEGVGYKTAACVMLFSFGLPALPVDTHVRRLSERIGLVRTGLSDARLHEELSLIIPAEQVYSFHLNMVEHGRRVCRATHPKCGECVLAGECCWYAKTRTA